MEKDIKLTKRDIKDKGGSNSSIIITPPLGLSGIERFKCYGEDIQPEAFAPDVRRVMRRIKKRLKKENIPSYLVTHKEIIDKNNTYVSESHIAFQIALGDLGLKKFNEEKIYSATYKISLVNTLTGTISYSKVITGTHSAKKKDNATKGFYGSLDNALDQFVSGPEFKQGLSID